MSGGGSQAVADIGVVSPATKSVALSAYEDRSTVLEMLRRGAVGYLVKHRAAVDEELARLDSAVAARWGGAVDVDRVAVADAQGIGGPGLA